MAGYIGNKAVNLSTSGADISGTANLDAVDIDGAVDFASTTAHAGNATFADNAKILMGAGSDLQLYHNGSASYITDQGTGNLVLGAADSIIFQNAAHNENMLVASQNGAVSLYHDNAIKLATTSTGVDVTGIIVSDGMSTNTSGTSNFIAGVNAGNSIASGGNNNTLIGDEAGTAITTGDSNVAVGKDALRTEDAHGKNVAVGMNALEDLNAGADGENVAVGNEAGSEMTTGIKNVLVGSQAGDALTDADLNVAIGMGSLTSDTLGSKSVAIGGFALLAQNFTTATDSYNTAVGYAAGLSVTTGTQNTLIGGLAGDALTAAFENVAIGYEAQTTDTLGRRTVAVGTGALQSQNFTTATNSYNTAVGYDAGTSVSTGTNNTYIGALAGDGTDDGLRNTAVGYLALSANADNDNTAIGVEALSVTTAANSTAVGQKAGSALTSGSNCLFLGQNAGLTGHPGGNFTTQSNALVIGNVSTSAAHVQVDWTVASDQRDKTDFTALDLGLDFVKALAPVTYKWDKRAKYGDITADDYDLAAQTPDGTHKEDWLDIGFKAQEVQALEEAAGYTTASKKNLTVSTSDDGKQMGLQYSKFVPILVKAIQEQNALIEALTARVATLEG